MHERKFGFLTEPVEFEIDGVAVVGYESEPILEAARRYGIDIPNLCHQPGYRPDGNCRSCVVEIEGERVLAPSCCRRPAPGMKVSSAGERARAAQSMVLELLRSDMPERGFSAHSELERWCGELGVGRPRFPGREAVAADVSHPSIAVNLDACIQCGRCVRGCREEQVNDVIGYAHRGRSSQITFDVGDPMGLSTCVGCGECVQACPTGALQHKSALTLEAPDRAVDTLCPYCGVGCHISMQVKGDRVLRVEGRDGPANRGRLCVKGRYGYDYSFHPDRLLRPLVRKEGVAKDPAVLAEDPAGWAEAFRPAGWDEALDLAGGALARIRDERGPKALAGFGSAKGSNEEAYLFQKLVRTGFGSNNVDHCTRLCHASSVAALLDGLGSGAVSNPVSDVMKAEVAILIGANPTVNHPVAATWIKNAIRGGLKLILVDPRRGDLSRLAAYHLRLRPDSDLALLNAMIHAIVEEGLVDEDFVRDRTKDFDVLRESVSEFAPEKMAELCGIDAEAIRAAARLYARSRRSMILWGMGISQHVHGTQNARCLISLSLMTGNIGREGTGLHPLRGQNNVQGASDAGLIPMVYPDYRRVDDPGVRADFEKAWGKPLDAEPGLTVVEIMKAADRGEIRGLYVMGENPAMSDPDLNHTRAAIAKLETLVVQDIFLTETAALADVILPASSFFEKTGTFTNTDRMVQMGRRVFDPPGEARQDLRIICDMAARLGLDWGYSGPDSGVREVYEEMRAAMPSIAGIGWERLEQEHSAVYPCARPDEAGQPVVFVDSFPTADGRGTFRKTHLQFSSEQPDGSFPFVLITGRLLEHWHTGAMTRRSATLDALEPSAAVAVHPEDLEELGLEAGAPVVVRSRRGAIRLQAVGTGDVSRGSVFIPFCFNEAAANKLTNPELDPFGKIPHFKYCAVSLSAADGSAGEGVGGMVTDHL